MPMGFLVIFVNMLQRLNLLALLLLYAVTSNAQSDSLSTDTTSVPGNPAPATTPPPPFIFKPTIGLGTGMFSYFGDLYSKHLMNPQVSRLAYELSVNQELTPFLRFGFYTCFGTLGANERLANRNINFESQIRSGGIQFEYNFANFLGANRGIHPWISAGFESFEFLSKTDLRDRNGNLYYYWSDGSIRSQDQNGPLASQAVFLQRDYTYESDIREMNLDGFGKYPERSFAIPVGVGVLMRLTDKCDARIGTTMHFGLTDYIDGVSDASKGNRVGNGRNDNFMATTVSIRYNLNFERKYVDSTGEDIFKDVDFYALDKNDYDKDGVPDTKDSCGNTPPGVVVDTHGCPLDDDHDGVPDFRDDEPTSAVGALVDARGVTLSDSLIQLAYDLYTDSTGRFALQENLPLRGLPYRKELPPEKIYTVWLGSYTKGLSNELLTQFLSINDIGTDPVNDSTTVYTAGKFTDVRSAEKRKRILLQQGLTIAKVVYKTPSGQYTDVNIFTNNPDGGGTGSDPLVTNDPKNNGGGTGTDPKNNGGGTGTDPKNNGGGTGTDPKNNGGGTGTDPKNNGGGTGTDPKNNGGGTGSDPLVGNDPSSNDDKIIFRVQLGAYRKKLSKATFSDVPELLEFKSEDGLYKYLSGSFATFDDAVNRKTTMLVKGYSGAFVVAYKKGKRISLTDAGVQLVTPEKTTTVDSTGTSTPTVSDNMVVFKVQVGVFKNDPPSDIQAKITAAGNIEKTLAPTGLTRYTYGSTGDYTKAQQLRDEIKAKGFPDAFIIAFFRGDYIPVSDALELLKKSDK